MLYSSTGKGGKVAIGTYLQLGLKVDIFLFKTLFNLNLALADMSLVYNTMTEFSFYPDSAGTTACTDYDIVTNIYQQVDGGDSLGWPDIGEAQLAYDRQAPSEMAVCYPIASGLSSKKKREDLEAWAGHLSSTGNEASHLQQSEEREPLLGLEKRQTGSMSMPGWDYGSGVAVNPNTYLGMGGNQFQANEPKFKCQNCLSCEGVDQDAPARCCGCESMDYFWVYSDIPNCDSCNPDDGTWPGVTIIGKRGEEVVGNDTLVGDLAWDSDAEDEEEEYGAGELSKRVYGTATISPKKVTVCGTKYWGTGNYQYPAFPAPANYPWEGIDGGVWDAISRYWGNLTADCSSWQITNRAQADTVRLGSNGATVRAKYQTEHVFEGQLIGDFFNWWLDQGQVNNQLPTPINPQSKVPCIFTQTYITAQNNAFPWRLNGQSVAFIQLLLSELGSIAHRDRLTIMLARPNRKKGSMFTGNQPTSPTTYDDMTQDEQLQSVKDIGMIFNYLNTQSVWNAFCGTYEAVYDHLGDFDTWYAANGAAFAIPNLQDEWKNYVRVALDSMVLRSRATFRYMYENRRSGIFGPLLDPPYSGY